MRDTPLVEAFYPKGVRVNSSRPAFLAIATAVLLASLLPSFVAGAGRSAGPSAAEPQFYLLQAEPLGYPLDDVAVHFEYRSGERVLGADDVLLGFGKDDSVLVPIPPSSWFLFGDTVPDLELLVFADGLLLARFDRALLARLQPGPRLHPRRASGGAVWQAARNRQRPL